MYGAPSQTSTIPYHTIPYLHRPLSYHTIPYHTIPYHTIPYHTIPYHTIPYHTICRFRGVRWLGPSGPAPKGSDKNSKTHLEPRSCCNGILIYNVWLTRSWRGSSRLRPGLRSTPRTARPGLWCGVVWYGVVGWGVVCQCKEGNAHTIIATHTTPLLCAACFCYHQISSSNEGTYNQSWPACQRSIGCMHACMMYACVTVRVRQQPCKEMWSTCTDVKGSAMRLCRWQNAVRRAAVWLAPLEVQKETSSCHVQPPPGKFLHSDCGLPNSPC